MTQAKATVKGRGPELFGRGIDLLFGDDQTAPRHAPDSPADDSDDVKMLEASISSSQAVSPTAPEASAVASTSNGNGRGPVFSEADVDEFLRMAAEAFLRVQTQKRQQLLTMQPTRGPSARDANATPLASSQGDDLAGFELDLPPLPDDPPDDPGATFDMQSLEGANVTPGTVQVMTDDFSAGDAVLDLDLDVPPLPEQQDVPDDRIDGQPAAPVEVTQPPPVITDLIAASEDHAMPDQPTPDESINQPVVSENGQPRAVAPPGVTVSGPITTLNGSKTTPVDSELSATLVDRELPALSRKEIEEILERLPKSDLRALDKQIDQLYEDVTKLFSGKRREITVAFEILRKARIILLKDPEQFAEAEYYVRQVQARVFQVRQSNEEGGHFWPRILIYQTVWLVVLSIVALITTVNGAAFVGWIAFLLGVPPASASVGWAVLFISTLAWGGIGGATAAMWSLYYHISVQRDYEPIENLWYYTQPLIGMVLGGIVFLIMGSGFLIVQATPTAGDAAIGARLVPAVIAVIAGFRQTVVLDMIERIVGLIAPTPKEPDSGASTGELSI